MSTSNSSTKNTSQLSNAIPFQTTRIAINECGGVDYRWTSDAIQLIRDECERELIRVFQNAQTFADHNKRKGISVQDFLLAREVTK